MTFNRVGMTLPDTKVEETVRAAQSYRNLSAQDNAIRQQLNKIGDILIEQGQCKIAEGKKERAEAETRLYKQYHDIMVNTVGKMIVSTVGTPSRAKDIANASLQKFENTKSQDLFVPLESKRCMRLTPTVAQVILDIFKTCPFTEPDLTKFLDEIDPEALRTVLTEIKATKVIFAKTAQESAAVKVALEFTKTASLVVAFA
jgi:O-acetyl-ADP-ribose deacetylase (regulator of RNase III)